MMIFTRPAAVRGGIAASGKTCGADPYGNASRSVVPKESNSKALKRNPKPFDRNLFVRVIQLVFQHAAVLRFIIE